MEARLADGRLGGDRVLRVIPLACALFAILLVSFGSPRAWGAQTPSASQITLSYRVIGGGSYTPPTVSYFFNDQNTTAVLSVNATTFDADAGSTWVVPQSLQGGPSYIRWEISGNNSGTVDGQTLVLVYYTQYYATFGVPPEVLDAGQYVPTVYYSYLGVVHNITAGLSTWADNLAPYSYNIIPGILPGTRWYCAIPTGVIQGAFYIDPGYVEQYFMNFTLSATGTEPLHSANFTYRFAGQLTNQTLGASGGTFWVDANTTFDFQPLIQSQSGTNQWVLHSVTPTNASGPIDVKATYFEQYPLSVSYSVIGGQAPSGPVVNEISNGNESSIEVYPGAPFAWVDAGSEYSVSPQLSGSLPDERWLTTSDTVGVVNGPTALSFVYFHQVFIGFGYSVAGGGNIPQSNMTYVSFGVQGSLPLSTAQQSIWADYGTPLTFLGNFTAGTPTERWMLGSAPSVVASKPGVLALVYYHQFLMPTTYSLVGGGNPPAPVLAATEFGVPFAHQITSGGSVWLDAGSAWTVPGTLSGGAGERWVAIGPTNGTVAAATNVAPSYGHEFYVTVVSDPAGSAVLTPSGWVQAGQSATIMAQPDSGWAFEGWLGTGQGSYSGSEQTFTTSASAPIQETASFDVEFAIRVTGSGNVLVSSGSHSYTVTGGLTLYVKPGTNITLTANPGILHSFTGWQGVPAGSASTVVMVKTPLSVTAGFGVNLVLAIGLIVLLCGVAIYAVAYLTWKKRVSLGRLLGLR